jgi:hypothetical protein
VQCTNRGENVLLAGRCGVVSLALIDSLEAHQAEANCSPKAEATSAIGTNDETPE